MDLCGADVYKRQHSNTRSPVKIPQSVILLFWRQKAEGCMIKQAFLCRRGLGLILYSIWIIVPDAGFIRIN